MENENHVMEWLPDYALEVLPQEETNQVVAHLAHCPSCQAEFQRLQQVAEALPLALTQTSPSPRVKADLMRAIHARKIKTFPSNQPISVWRKLVGFLRMPLPAIGLALILVMVMSNLLLWRQLRLVSSLPDTNMRVIALANTQDSPQAVGSLVMDPNGHYGTLVVDKLAELDASHAYQVWLTRSGERISAGLFSVNYDGYASLELSAPRELIQYDTIGITVEPAGGSPGPTGAKVLGGDIPH